MLSVGLETHPEQGTKNVRYLTEAERRNHKLDVNGLTAPAVGPLDGTYMFVMDRAGDIYVGTKITGHFHHSSLLGATPVSSAGMISVGQSKAGRLITKIENLSGHYKPGTQEVKNLLNTIPLDKFASDCLVEVKVGGAVTKKKPQDWLV